MSDNTSPADENEAELALRRLACWLGAGGYNAPTVDAKVFEEKIKWGIEEHGKTWALANNITARDLAEQVLAMDLITSKGLRAKHLARTILGIKTADESAPPLAAQAAPAPLTDATRQGLLNALESGSAYVYQQDKGRMARDVRDTYIELMANAIRAALAAPGVPPPDAAQAPDEVVADYQANIRAYLQEGAPGVPPQTADPDAWAHTQWPAHQLHDNGSDTLLLKLVRKVWAAATCDVPSTPSIEIETKNW